MSGCEGSGGGKGGVNDGDEGAGAAEAGAEAIPSLTFASDPLAAVAAGQAFAVVPLEWCPHLEFPNALNPMPPNGVDVKKVEFCTRLKSDFVTLS